MFNSVSTLTAMVLLLSACSKSTPGGSSARSANVADELFPECAASACASASASSSAAPPGSASTDGPQPVASVAASTPAPAAAKCNAVDSDTIAKRIAERSSQKDKSAWESELVNKIVGGKPSTLQLTVALMETTQGGKAYRQHCGATAISSKWLLTAAHCVVQEKENFALAGVTDLNEWTDANRREIVEVLNHAGYDPVSRKNDIALVKLDKPIAVGFAALPKSVQEPTPDALVSGWGETEQGKLSDILLEVGVPIVSNDECANNYKPRNVSILSSMLCAGKKGKDSCQGDSGGPLLIPGFQRPTVTGVVSFGIGCGQDKLFGVYTRVYDYVDWIKTCSGVSP